MKATAIHNTGNHLAHIIGPRRAGDVEQVFADTKKSSTVLGWRTQHDLRDALRDAWRWQQGLGK